MVFHPQSRTQFGLWGAADSIRGIVRFPGQAISIASFIGAEVPAPKGVLFGLTQFGPAGFRS